MCASELVNNTYVRQCVLRSTRNGSLGYAVSMCIRAVGCKAAACLLQPSGRSPCHCGGCLVTMRGTRARCPWPQPICSLCHQLVTSAHLWPVTVTRVTPLCVLDRPQACDRFAEAGWADRGRLRPFHGPPLAHCQVPSPSRCVCQALKAATHVPGRLRRELIWIGNASPLFELLAY